MNHRVCDILVKKTSGKTISAQGKSVLFFAMGSDRSKRHPGLSGRSIFHFFATIHCPPPPPPLPPLPLPPPPPPPPPQTG